MPHSRLGPNPTMYYGGRGGVSTPYGVLLPPGSKVAAYVSSLGVQEQDPPEIQNNLVKTLAEGLKYARSGRGDAVVLLPGHTESVIDATMLDNLVAGTKIIGLGHGSTRPTFLWTATGGQWKVNKDNVIVTGLAFNMVGAVITKAIAITGTGCALVDNFAVVAAGASLKATIAFEVGTGGDNFLFQGNEIHGTPGDNVTDGLLIAAAVGGVRILDNIMFASATSANGLIRLSAAATRMFIGRNVIMNSMTTAANVGIALGTAAATGMCWGNRIGILTGGAMVSGTHGISFGGSVDFRFYDNLISDSANGDGIGLITDAA